MALIQISTELTITFTSLKVFTSCAGCNIPDCFDFIVSILVVKPRKTDSQSISESVLFLFREQPKLSIFECSAKQRFDFHNNL